ncbi:uncharacterized protein LOC132058519 [Lycium ferocissimum]|uniref:uncharacterized protein LOC132058519 n=1 Tax=Lycium ferocissimum TaxID=112874 RepID=UPI00281572F0|nr:uncharacterized protein LOC132058519 [Lycium ferocissimum]
MPPAAVAHGRNFPPDSSFYGYDMNHYDMVTGNISTSLEMGNYDNDQKFPSSTFAWQLAILEGSRSSYNQRSSPAFRASSSYLRQLQAICAMGMLVLQMTHHSCLLKVTPQDIHGHCLL